MPVNSRSSSVYQNQVPARPNTEPANPEAPQQDGNVEMGNLSGRNGEPVNPAESATPNGDAASGQSFITRLLNPTNYQSTAEREQANRGAYSSVNTDSTHG
jgi:hypothetical protein